MLTIVLTSQIHEQILSVANEPLESAGVLLARFVSGGEERHTKLLALELIPVPADAYLRREGDHMSIASSGYVPALARAESLQAVPIWFHTHPGQEGIPLQSDADRTVDAQIVDLFKLRSNSPFYGNLIVSPRCGEYTFSGSFWPEGAETAESVDRIWVVGDRYRLIPSYGSNIGEIDASFDRNVLAFGSAMQRTLQQLRVAIVGCGGTGSAVTEQLVRLGVRHLTLIDPDILSGSNITRVYGSGFDDVGKAKVDILSKHLSSIARDLDIRTVQSSITLEASARLLVQADLIFGCTDDNAGRLVLSRLATYYLTPVIDLGVLLSSNEKNQLVGINGRVTVLGPKNACLVCRNRIDLRRASAEMHNSDERASLEAEGYAPSSGTADPAVVVFTTAVAAAGVNELLERLVGYGQEPRPSELLLRLHDREISTNRLPPTRGHYCDEGAGKLGLGDRSPFLDQAWR